MTMKEMFPDVSDLNTEQSENPKNMNLKANSKKGGLSLAL